MYASTTVDNVKHDSPGVNIAPPAMFLACLILGGVLEFLFPHSFPILTITIRIVAGLVIGGAGFAIMGIAHGRFQRIGTNVPTNQPATTLVISGAYRFSRNPMYLGGSVFFLGIGLIAGSLWMLASYLPLGFYLVLYVIPHEEAYMERVFGEDYRAYCRHVRRWL
ncbi:MAG: isoprenylcysteine carboxylmethyltransferase family protein [Planctomycetes bacterium]|nr:isoprenylcysteine carboxylmethyltransferase family protein [Planctomycetota bacterium]